MGESRGDKVRIWTDIPLQRAAKKTEAEKETEAAKETEGQINSVNSGCIVRAEGNK
jgi:hypothetical protein